MAALNTYYNSRCPVCRPAIEKYAASKASRDADLQWRDINEDEAALAREIVWDRAKGLGRLSAKSILATALVGIVAGTVAAWAITRCLLP